MAQASSPLIQRWSTRDVPAAQGLEYYASAVSGAVDAMRVARRAPGPFEAEISVATLGPLSVVHGVGSAHECLRDAADMDASSEYHHLILNAGGDWSVTRGMATRIRAGDAVLLDARLGRRLDFTERFDNVHLKLPTSWLRRWLPNPERLVGQPIAPDGRWGDALLAFVAQFSPETVVRAPVPASMLADHVGALLALYASGMDGPASPGAPDRDMATRIREAIDERCPQPLLTAAEIAMAIGISTRTLHRSLAASGLAFGSLLIEARIRLATRMLESPLFRRLTTAEIGRRAGFRDPSHFARAYRRARGQSPGQAQARAAARVATRGR
jgi:AraC-like DNA-binding protein